MQNPGEGIVHNLSALQVDVDDVQRRLQTEATGATIHKARNLELTVVGLWSVINQPEKCASDCEKDCLRYGRLICTRGSRDNLAKAIINARAWLWKNGAR